MGFVIQKVVGLNLDSLLLFQPQDAGAIDIVVFGKVCAICGLTVFLIFVARR